MDIKVSIIVPVYKVEEFLAECLDSLVNQTLKDIEILCVNDGSPDRCGEILEEYAKKDSRVIVINQANGGISVARNNALKIAKGEYVGFVDSDDWVSLDFYEKLYNAAKKNSCDIACAGYTRCGKHLKKIKLKYEEEKICSDAKDKLVLAEFPRFNYVWNKIYHRENLLKTNLLFPEGKIFEDIFWSAQVIYALGNMVSVPDCAYFYRRREGSIVKKRDAKKQQDSDYATQVIVDFIESKNLESLLKNFKMTKYYYKLCGFKILKIIEYYPNSKKYYLFRLIPLSPIIGEKIANSFGKKGY